MNFGYLLFALPFAAAAKGAEAAVEDVAITVVTNTNEALASSLLAVAGLDKVINGELSHLFTSDLKGKNPAVWGAINMVLKGKKFATLEQLQAIAAGIEASELVSGDATIKGFQAAVRAKAVANQDELIAALDSKRRRFFNIDFQFAMPTNSFVLPTEAEDSKKGKWVLQTAIQKDGQVYSVAQGEAINAGKIFCGVYVRANKAGVLTNEKVATSVTDKSAAAPAAPVTEPEKPTDTTTTAPPATEASMMTKISEHLGSNWMYYAAGAVLILAGAGGLVYYLGFFDSAPSAEEDVEA